MDYKKISKLLFFSTILILLSCEKKQYNYIHYYQKVNEIDSIYRFTNNPIETVKQYKLLFNKYPAKNQSRIREYETYIVLADMHNMNFGGKKSLKKLIYLTAPYSDFGRNTDYYPLYNKYGLDRTKIDREIKNWKKSINPILVDSFTIAMKRDQKFRIIGDWENMEIADKKNSDLLKWTFENYGYPSIYKIGIKGNDNTNLYLDTLFLHMSESEDYRYIIQKLYKYIVSGDCPPQIYSTLVDRYETTNNKRMIYGDYGILENVDSSKLESNRKAIGLPGLKHNLKITQDRYIFKNLMEN